MRNGWRVAFFAVTRAYNPAPRRFYTHIGSHYIAYADSAWLYPAIRRLKASGAADFVVVSIHAGTELSDGPDEPLRQFLEGAVDAGADLCLGHHPHVLQPVEWYRGKPIAYSMGNFIFKQGAPWTAYSGVFTFTVAPDGRVTADVIPVRSGFQARFASRRRGRQCPAARPSRGPPPPHPLRDLAMTKPSHDFLKRLLDSPGPSGFETAPARVWREEVKGFADEMRADVHGNSVGGRESEGRPAADVRRATSTRSGSRSRTSTTRASAISRRSAAGIPRCWWDSG